jgi:hypothetical protein
MEPKVSHQQEIPEVPREVATAAIATLGANPFAGLHARRIFGTYARSLREVLKRPEVLGGGLASLASELAKIAAGVSKVTPDSGDKRLARLAADGSRARSSARTLR